MQPTPDEVYKQIDNALYNEQGDTWWNESQCLHLLKSSVNPVALGTSENSSIKCSSWTIAAQRRWM